MKIFTACSDTPELNVLPMPRCELVTPLAKRFPQLLIKDVQVSVSEIINGICQTLIKGDRLEVRGFGRIGLGATRLEGLVVFRQRRRIDWKQNNEVILLERIDQRAAGCFYADCHLSAVETPS